MGVPALFRWIQRKYPLIITNCIEEEIENENDYSNQNPNTIGDVDFDCLYLDMNGIIHPCFHSQESNAPLAEEEIFQNIDNYINRLFNIVRPRKLLFMAIDGVAPRAKMNQQRARRYRSSKDSIFDHLVKLDEAKKSNNQEALNILDDPDYLIKHDTNVITPGTQFMRNLSKHLQQFIKKQQEDVQAWKNISVILSDASVPGEGEHKIMDFIRGQRLEQGYDPNRHHCICGLDADLIFLGLTSHELYFTILREKVLEDVDGFQFVSLWVLRQYLEMDLKPVSLPFDWNFENAIDDLVFLCFAIGNDFIPGVPGFSIQAGVINAIIAEYAHNLPKLGGYLTEEGVPNFTRLCKILSQLSKFEGKSLDSIIHPSDSSTAAQNFVNEICDTDDLVLHEMRYRNYIHKNEKVIRPETVPNIDELKSKYYELKFGKDCDKTKIIKEYLTAMYWILMYYTHGCVSWSWFYPYHYPPCVSDFSMIENFEVTFDLNEPFDPLVQLMAVLPPQSSQFLPKKFSEFMLNEDSPLKQFYPTKFRVDLIGGTTTWKGIVLVPFIDADLLISTIDSCEDLQLTSEEKHRNKTGKTKVYLSDDNPNRVPESSEGDVYGPQIWGKINPSPKGGYIYEFRKITNDQVTSFLHLGIKLPPSIININHTDPFMRGISQKAKNSENAGFNNFFGGTNEIPLQIPGYPPGKSSDFRIRVMQNSSRKIHTNFSKNRKSSLFDF